MKPRRAMTLFASTALLATGGFAAASIASGGGLPLVSSNGSTALTGTGPLPPRVTICHHTGSRKHPMHTITVSSHAWPAHSHHGDTLGPCGLAGAQTVTSTTKSHGHGNGHGNLSGQSGVNGNGHGNGNGNGHGNGNQAGTLTQTQTETVEHGNQGNGGQGNGNGNGNGHGHP
jgi:hypothetical protein